MGCLPKDDSLRRQYKIKRNIGRGAFGHVKLARHRLTDILVAIKTTENLQEHLRIIMAEMVALKFLKHPYILEIFQIIITPDYTHIITEYAPGGSLAKVIRKGGRLQEKEAQRLFGQLVSAIRYCHDNDIIHRDLKPQNILLDREGNIKVADFGLAQRSQPGTLLQGRCGTSTFNAPELLLGEVYDGKKADVWSLGVVLYCMTTGHHPFKGSNPKDTEGNIILGSYEVPSHVSGQLENLLHQMLTVAPEKRPTIEDIEQHPWVMRCDVNIPDDSYPDPDVINLMANHGFSANAIRESIHNETYDELMGTYLIIKRNLYKDHELHYNTSGKPAVSEATPSTSPAPRLTRGSSEPIFVSLHTQPSQQNLTPLGRKLTKSSSHPQCCPQRVTPTCSHAPLSRTAAAPCVGNSIMEEKMPLPSGLHPDTESSPQNIGCFRRLGKTIRACLSRFCCFSSSERETQPMINNRVAPMKEAGGRAQ